MGEEEKRDDTIEHRKNGVVAVMSPLMGKTMLMLVNTTVAIYGMVAK